MTTPSTAEAKADSPAPEGRRGRRAGRRRDAGPPPLPRLPWRSLRNPLPPIEVLSADQVEAIHRASLRVLAEAGLTVTDGEARSLYRAAGAKVEESDESVRFDPALIEELVARAPGRFTIAARNPERDIAVGGNAIAFQAVGGPAFVSDLERGRRAGTMADLRDFMRLVQQLDIVQLTSIGSLAALDLPVQTRHLHGIDAAIRESDKVWAASLLGRGRARDALEMAAIVHGTTLDGLADRARPPRPLVHGNININSPRLLDGPMAQGAIEFARHGQPVVVTPFTLSGAMAPATLAGALVQQNAEALGGIALVQAVRPGAPVVYGGFTSNVDMKSGAPAFGTPEYTKAVHATGQLCRRYGLPYRSSNTNASNCVDAQAAYESAMSLWGVVMGHVNLVNHAAGWLEGGLVCSFEKLILDAEMLQCMAEYLEPIAVDADSLAVEAIRETPPAGHFFGSEHTLARYETAFYQPLLSDWRNFETWKDDGAQSAAERAHAIWKRLLEEAEPPALDSAIGDSLRDYIARRERDLVDAEAIER